MSEAFKDELTNESDVLKTCDMGGSLYVERFPSPLSFSLSASIQKFLEKNSGIGHLSSPWTAHCD